MHITTTAPIPRLTQWPSMIFGPLADAQAIAKPWLLAGDRPLWFSRAAWGLRAIAEGTAIKLGRMPNLWLPDFFCNQSTWPSRQAGVPLTFYPIDRDLRPKWTECAALSKGHQPDLFVLVHYFGDPVETAEARLFCDRFGASLIEDAAHLLMPAGMVGKDADFVLYSPYKHLPIPDGGLIIIRPAARELTNEIEKVSGLITHAAPSVSSWVAKRFLQSIAPAIASALSGSKLSAFDDDPVIEQMSPNAAFSISARRMIASLSDRLNTIAERRRTNEKMIRRIFRGAEGLEPYFSEFDDRRIPYRAMLQASDHDVAQHWYSRIHSSGNVVETWPDLAPEVKSAPEHHSVAIGLRQTLLGLPINADRSPDELRAAYGAVL